MSFPPQLPPGWSEGSPHEGEPAAPRSGARGGSRAVGSPRTTTTPPTLRWGARPGTGRGGAWREGGREGIAHLQHCSCKPPRTPVPAPKGTLVPMFGTGLREVGGAGRSMRPRGGSGGTSPLPFSGAPSFPAGAWDSAAAGTNSPRPGPQGRERAPARSRNNGEHAEPSRPPTALVPPRTLPLHRFNLVC